MTSIPSTFCCNVSARGRLCLSGEDRVRFLNGQVTNDVKALSPGKGCYAAFTNMKGKMRADTMILHRGETLLLDLESGYDSRIATELNKFIIADDVQIENLSASWNAYTVLGSRSVEVLQKSGLCNSVPSILWESGPLTNREFGNAFIFRTRRSRDDAFDIWVESSYSASFEKQLSDAVSSVGGTTLEASRLEIPRIEAGIPRFGCEMDENTLPSEAGIESIAISYTKGCYLGQEVIARIKSVGHVNRILVRLNLPTQAEAGSALLLNDKEIGKLGSAVTSPQFGRIGLAIVRREAAAPGTLLSLSKGEAKVVEDFIRT